MGLPILVAAGLVGYALVLRRRASVMRATAPARTADRADDRQPVER